MPCTVRETFVLALVKKWLKCYIGINIKNSKHIPSQKMLLKDA